MKILHYSKDKESEVLKEVTASLLQGNLFIFPTETTYGIGADATNPAAIEKLMKYKGKRGVKPFSIAVSGREMAAKYALINTTAENIYRNFLPGPITVISEGKHLLAPYVESPLGTVGIRIPDYALIRKIAEVYGRPFTATSANASYQKRPYKIEDILENISEKQKQLVDLIIDVGELPHREPSTVVDTTLDELSILRQGDIVLTDFEKVVTESADDTAAFAESLIRKYSAQIGNKTIIFALQGDMGAGKTQFAKGLGKALKIEAIISSPTYTMEQDYPFTWKGKTQTLIHVDTWRMFSSEEFSELRMEERIGNGNIIAIEWAEKVYGFIKSTVPNAFIIWLKFSALDENTREIIYSDTFIT